MGTPDIQHILKTASDRLGETITLFAASKAVNDCCHKDVNQQLFHYVNTDRFWRTTYAAFQTFLFINIPALVDKRADCSSLRTAADLLEEQKPGVIPKPIFDDLESIRDQYKVFRSKVFAHTDHKRAALAEIFDAAGFSWASIDAALRH